MVIFQAVVVAVCLVSALIATTAFLRSRDMYDRIGRLGTFWLASDEDEGPPSGREVEEMRAAIAAVRARRRAEVAGSRPDADAIRGSSPDQAKTAPRATRRARARPPLDAP
jgi:hypothetical protein